MKKKLQRLIFKNWEIILLINLSLTPVLWLHGNQIVLGHDSGFRINTIWHLKNLYYSWTYIYNFGVDLTLYKGFLITQFPEYFFSLVFRETTYWQTATFVFWFMLMIISMYVFTRSFFPSKDQWLIRIISSILYVYNFYILQAWFIVERAKFSLYAALPLFILIFYKTLNRDYKLSKGLLLFCILFLLLNGGSSPPLFGAIFLCGLLVFFYSAVQNILSKNIKEFIYSLKVVIIFFVGFIFVSAYWVFPQIYLILTKYYQSIGSYGGVEGILSWEQSVNKFASILNLLRMQGIPDWYDNSLHSFSSVFTGNNIFIALSFVFIIVILLGTYLESSRSRKSPSIIYLVKIIFIVSFIFVAGSHEPFGTIYVYLIKYVPGFAIFRSAIYKFGPALWFSMAILFGFYVNLLINEFTKNNLLKKVFSVILLLFILIYHFPYFTGSFFDYNKPFSTRVVLPNYVSEMTSYINENIDANERILLMPKLDSHFRADGYTWGYWSLDILPRLMFKPAVVVNGSLSPEYVEDIYKSLDENNENFLSYLNSSNIKYILYRDDVLYTDKKTNSKNFLSTKKKIDENKNITLVKKLGEWTLYKVNNNDGKNLFTVNNYVEISPNITSLVSLNKLAGYDNKNLFINIDSNNEAVRKLASENVVKLDCVYCGIINNIKTSKQISRFDTNILPGSFLYFYKEYKNNKLVESNSNNYPASIDMYLVFSTQKLSELEKLSSKTTPNSNVINTNVDLYTTYLDEITNNLTHVDNQDFYKLRIKNYLENHYDRITKSDNISERNSKILLKKILDTENYISQSMNIDTDTDNYLYTFDIEKATNLDILIDDKYSSRLLLNNEKLDRLNNLFLESGKYYLVIRPEEITSASLTQTKEDSRIEIDIDSTKNEILYKYVNLPKNTYDAIFKMTYYDKNNKALTEKEFKVSDLVRENILEFWDEIPKGSSRVEIWFDNFTKGENISLDNLSIFYKDSPDVFLRFKNDTNNFITSKIKSTKLSNILYKVDINKNNNSSILVLNDQFDKGWKIYLDPSTKNPLLSAIVDRPLPEDSHLKVNNYANAWFISNASDNGAYIIFWPIVVFYFGLLTSVVSMIILLLIYLIYGKKNKKN